MRQEITNIVITEKNFNIAVHEGSRKILSKILYSDVLPSDAYLAGGTAVSIYFGHRLSDDFDFFSIEQLNTDVILSSLKKEFYKIDPIIVLSHSIVCNIYLKQNIFTKFSIFKLPYKLLEPTLLVSDNKELSGFPVHIASMMDLFCMKSVAIAQRGSAKDFVDLYYMLTANPLEITWLMKKIKMKYGLTDNFLYQLKTGMCYFEDADKKELLEKVLMYIPLTGKYSSINPKVWKKIKKFFINFCYDSQKI